MDKIWYDITHPGGFGSYKELADASGKSTKEAKQFLIHQETYQRAKQFRKKFPRRRIKWTKARQFWSTDLLSLIDLSRHNSGIKYVMVLKCALSKFIYLYPLKSKTAIEVAEAFKDFLRKEPGTKFVFSDMGKEYVNSVLRKLFDEKNVKLLTSYNPDTKAAPAENLNRYLRTRLEKYFLAFNTKRYVDVLPAMQDAYNHRINKAHGLRPVDVNEENELDVYYKLFGHQKRSLKSPKFLPGDRVRIFKGTHVLLKGSKPMFSSTVYTIKECFNTIPITYSVQGEDEEEPLKGIFYEEELSVVPTMKVLQYKNRRGKRYVKIETQNGNKWILAKSLNKYI